MRLIASAAVALLAFPAFAGVAASPDAYDGEVLVAPPPPNWSGGTIIERDHGTAREWVRIGTGAIPTVERIVINEFAGRQVPDALAEAAAKRTQALKDCQNGTAEEPALTKKAAYASARFSVVCADKSDDGSPAAAFGLIEVLAGEFNFYMVERYWRGGAADPGLPSGSKRVLANWTQFFDRIRICNTMSDTCNTAAAAMIHAHPRFSTMRPPPVVTKPVLAPAKALKAATAFGELTGRAETCNENTKQLLAKIGQMFDYVTANDKERTQAVAAFEKAIPLGRAKQAKIDVDECGAILRSYREYPLRLSAFHKFLERFL